MAPSAPTAEANGHRQAHPSRLFSLKQEPSLDAFKKLTSQVADPSTYRLASTVISSIPIYDLARLEPSPELSDEWHHILISGPGVYILKHFTRPSLIDRVNVVLDSIIDSEKATAKGDHFAASGSNSRIWNSFQKHAEKDPASFVQYYANPWLAHVAESWLGPAYQVTAQVNVVHPGGKPQMAHRDYHVGFQTAEASARFPKAMHVASQFLTLQGAVAHTDMPLESGPTRFLPFSQKFEEGFMAYRLKQFSDHFEQNWVSAPLEKGDAVFFNPALFHAAGQNDSLNERSANLLQISSAFGRTMETIDTARIIEKTWSEAVKTSPEIIKSIAQGYPFPTNLDLRPPTAGMAPESEQDILRRAWNEGWNTEAVMAAIRQLRQDSTTATPA